MAWRLAVSLETLRDEFNAAYPSRSKRSDGTIGDAAHRNRASRHNPNRHGVVTALDITHDPSSGCDVHKIARQLANDPHPELAYIISDGQLASRATGFGWRNYTGSNQHTAHAHFAVGQGPDSDPRPPYDSTQAWGVTDQEDDMALKRGDTGKRVTALQARLTWWRDEDLDWDGEYGPATEAAVKRWQDKVGLDQDGVWTETEWALLLVNAIDNGHIAAGGSSRHKHTFTVSGETSTT